MKPRTNEYIYLKQDLTKTNKLFFKTVKGLLLPALGIFFLAIAWANWNPPTYSEQNVPAAIYIAMDLSSSGSTDKYKEIEKEMISLDGVTACSLNATGKLAGVMFVPAITSKEVIREKLSAILESPVTEKEFEPVKNGCPVGGLTSFILAVKQTLRFRS